MRNKKGISLIVLVITIIVMIILAAAVVVSLNNTGIIGKANTAVSKTNLKQIESLASLAWADAFMDGARTQEALEDAVMDSLKDVDTSKYTIIVTEAGVTVTEGNTTNEYGFYYDVPYNYTVVQDDGTEIEVYLVFKANKTVELFYGEFIPSKYALFAETGNVSYEIGKVILLSSDGTSGPAFTIEDNGRTLSVTADDGEKFEFKYSNEKYSDVKYNQKYYSENGDSYIIVESDNTVKLYGLDGELWKTVSGTDIEKTTHLLVEKDESTSSSVNGSSIKAADPLLRVDVFMDGEVIGITYDYLAVKINDGKVSKFIVHCDHATKELEFKEGMTWTEWVASSYNTVGATIDADGYVEFSCSENTDYIKTFIASHQVNKDEKILPGFVYIINYEK